MSFYAKDYTTWIDGYDFTTDLNELSMTMSRDALDNTAFGASARNRAKGLEDASTTLSGWWAGGDTAVDKQAFDNLSSSLLVATHSPDGDAGSVAYTYRAVQPSYQIGGKVGDVLPFTLSLAGTRGNAGLSAGVVRGTVAASKVSPASTGAIGQTVTMTALTSGEFAYCSLHVFAAGTTMSVKLESAASTDTDFESATSRATLTVTAAGGYWLTRKAGPITDTLWRVNVTAITGDFTVSAVIGKK